MVTDSEIVITHTTNIAVAVLQPMSDMPAKHRHQSLMYKIHRVQPYALLRGSVMPLVVSDLH